MNEWRELLLPLAATAVYYGLIPMLIVLFARKISGKTYKRVCIVSSAVLAVIAFILEELMDMGTNGSFFPAVLWGWVFYKIGVNIIAKRTAKQDSQKSESAASVPEPSQYIVVDTSTGEVVVEATELKKSSDKQKVTPEPEAALRSAQTSNSFTETRHREYASLEFPPKRTRPVSFWVAWVLAMVCIALVAAGVYLQTEHNAEIDDMQAEIKGLNLTNASLGLSNAKLKKENSDLKEEVDYIDDNFVFFAGGYFYHRYGCKLLEEEKSRTGGMAPVNRFDLSWAFGKVNHDVSPCNICRPGGERESPITK